MVVNYIYQLNIKLRQTNNNLGILKLYSWSKMFNNVPSLQIKYFSSSTVLLYPSGRQLKNGFSSHVSTYRAIEKE